MSTTNHWPSSMQQHVAPDSGNGHPQSDFSVCVHPKASTLSSWIAFEGAVLPRELGFRGAHSPRCRWSCSPSLSPRSCRTRCSLTLHYWNVLTPLVREAAVGRCKATRGAIRGFPLASAYPSAPRKEKRPRWLIIQWLQAHSQC